MHSLELDQTTYSDLVTRYEQVVLERNDGERFTWLAEPGMAVSSTYFGSFEEWIAKTFKAEIVLTDNGDLTISLKFENEQDLIWFELKA